MVTLHHFVHPTWFDQLGGFTEAANVSYFVNFATFAFRQVIEELQQLVHTL